MAKRKPPPFSAAELDEICRLLADTETGLTGSQIGQALAQIRVKDTHPTLTKWKRLFNALGRRQQMDGSADRVLAFISLALAPVRYRGQPELYSDRRDAVNVTLAFRGLEFKEDGRFHRVAAAKTLTEAEERANRLRAALDRRGVHTDVLAFCKVEFLQKNSFHAVLEATKSVAEKIRARTGLTSDGARLVDDAFNGSSPKLRINGFSTESEKSEQRGFANLLKGLFGTFRNPTAHAPRVSWSMSEEMHSI